MNFRYGVRVAVCALIHGMLAVISAEDKNPYDAVIQISLSTSTEAKMQQRSPVCEVCGCSFCPDGFAVGSLSGLIEIPVGYRLATTSNNVTEVPCALLDYAGNSGQITEANCNDDFRLFSEFREVCDCPPLPVPSASKEDDGQFGTDGDGDPVIPSKAEKGKEKKEKDEKVEKTEKSEDKEKEEKDEKQEKMDKSENEEKDEKQEKMEKNESEEKEEKDEKQEKMEEEKMEKSEGTEKKEKTKKEKGEDEDDGDGQFGTDGRRRLIVTRSKHFLRVST